MQIDLSLVKDLLAIVQYFVIFLIIPIWKFLKSLNKTIEGMNKSIEDLNGSLNRLNNTVRFFETIVLDIADDATIAKATKKLKGIKEVKNGDSNNI